MRPMASAGNEPPPLDGSTAGTLCAWLVEVQSQLVEARARQRVYLLLYGVSLATTIIVTCSIIALTVE